MALLAEVYRIIIKAGLLPKLIRFLPSLSLLVFILGWGWLFFLPTDGQYRHTYISENALMPSQAYSYFRESEWNILRGYRTQINEMDPLNIDQNLEVMAGWFKEIGFKVQYHHTEHNTTNLYAIWHTPRADGTEAIVLGSAYYQTDNEFNIGGLSLLFSLSRYFQRWSIWSKNLIFVIPHDPELSLRSWVNEYHNSLEYAGSIESAMMLDYPSNSDNFEYVELYYEGLNGQLPNLDLINTFVSVTEHEGPRVSLHQLPFSELDRNDYWARLKIMLQGLKSLSLAGISKFNGQEAFSGWKIQALTMKAIFDSEGSGPYDITTFGRVPEAVFRSVNNLLEKFHQSFFFYLLLRPRLFISIGTYLPSGGLILASFLLSFLDNILNHFGRDVMSIVNYLNELGVALIGAVLLSFVVFQTGCYASFGFSFGVLMVSSFIFANGSNSIHIKSSKRSKALIRALALFYLVLNLGSLVTLNFALTLSISTLAIPLTFIKDNRKMGNVLLMLTNPLLQLIVISLFAQLDSEGSELAYVLKFFERLISSWLDMGNHTWIVVTMGYLPAWLLMGYSNLLVYDSEQDKIKKEK